MENQIKCKDCVYYDCILGRRERKTKRGWCSKKSVYPAQEGPGQTFPLNVRRAATGELGKPVIVIGDAVEKHCKDARLKRGLPQG